MIKRLAVLAIFLGYTTVEAVQLGTYNQLEKRTPPELAEKTEAKEEKEDKKETPLEIAKVEAKQVEHDAKAASTEATAKAISTEATSAAANADPILTVNTAHNAARVKRAEVILDPKILKANQAVADAVQAAKDRVSAEPTIKAQRDKYNLPLPDPLAPDQPLNPLITEFRRARTAADVPSHELGNPDVTSVAGPAVTDQIGKSVYDSAMKGCDETPGPRNILSKKDPSFTPGPLPPIPSESGAKEVSGVVVVKQSNPDKTPTKQDVADAVAKADKDMKDALTPSGKNDPLNDPEFALEKAHHEVSTKQDSEVAGHSEMAKAEVKVAKEAKAEEKKNAVEAKEIAHEKAEVAAEEEKAATARKVEDEAKTEAKKAEKKADEAKAEAEQAEKHVEEVKKEAENAKADTRIEKRVKDEDREAAKDLSPQQAEEKTNAERREKESDEKEKRQEEKNKDREEKEERTASSRSIKEEVSKRRY